MERRKFLENGAGEAFLGVPSIEVLKLNKHSIE